MQKLLLPFSLLLCLSLLIAAAGNEKRHIGLWKGEDKGDIGYIYLGDDGYAYFVNNSDTLGGKSYKQGEQEACLKYVVLYTDSFHTIDFNIHSIPSNTLLGTLRGIFKFNKNDGLTLAIEFDYDQRPAQFDEDNSIILEKVAINKK